jgi:hypothetical protein
MPRRMSKIEETGRHSVLLLSHSKASQTEMRPDTERIDSFGHVRNRALHHLIAHWFGKCGGRVMPAVCDIEPTEIRLALAKIWLCDYLPQDGRLRYRLAGEEINDFWGFNLGGKYLDEIVPPGRLASATKKCRMALELPAIIYDRTCLSLTEEITRTGERIILPLSDDGKTVNALLGASHRDWFRDLELDPFTTYSETTSVTAL